MFLASAIISNCDFFADIITTFGRSFDHLIRDEVRVRSIFNLLLYIYSRQTSLVLILEMETFSNFYSLVIFKDISSQSHFGVARE